MRYSNSKRGKRAGSSARDKERRDIHSKIVGMPSGTHSNHHHNLHGTSATAVVADAAKYYDGAFVEETRETHVVPRQSITRKQFLGIFPPKLHLAPMVARQLDKATGKMVVTTDNRLVWKSDSTLLNRGNPFRQQASFKREGSVSIGLNKRKTLTTVPEYDTTIAHKLPDDTVVIEEKVTVLGPAIDGVDLE